MKKSLSYLLPIGAILILAILAYRWLGMRQPAEQGTISQSAEGIEISDLTGEDIAPSGVQDMMSAPLTTSPEATASATGNGEIRYTQDESDRTRFTVNANLPMLDKDEGFYQLWFDGGKGTKKAMRLEYGKAGFTGEGVITSEFDQVKVIISKEQTDDDTLEEMILEGQVDFSVSDAENDAN